MQQIPETHYVCTHLYLFACTCTSARVCTHWYTHMLTYWFSFNCVRN